MNVEEQMKRERVYVLDGPRGQRQKILVNYEGIIVESTGAALLSPEVILGRPFSLYRGDFHQVTDEDFKRAYHDRLIAEINAQETPHASETGE